MSEFLDLWVWIWIVGICILFKMSFGWVIYPKVWDIYAWSKLSWLFLQNPNLATFGFWWIVGNPWWIMINPWSNDECDFKIFMLTKNLEVWCMLTTVDFLPNTIDFQSSEPLIEQTCDARLKTWYEHPLIHMRTHESHLRP